MKTILALVVALTLQGCASLIPSFWDDNQSARIIDIEVKIRAIDCAHPQRYQIVPIQTDITWFQRYSAAKGGRQADVQALVEPMAETVNAWVVRDSGSQSYCQLKKRILTEQSERAARAVLGRY